MDLVGFKKHVDAFSKSDVLTIDQLKRNFQLGLLGEVGEFIDLFKKHLYHGDVLDLAKVKSEAGDILWYLYALGEVYELDFGITSNKPLTGLVCAEENMAYLLTHLFGSAFALVQDLSYESGEPEEKASAITCLLLDVISPFGLTLQDCMVANVEKLTKRHGGNAFNREAQRANKPLESQPVPHGWDKV